MKENMAGGFFESICTHCMGVTAGVGPPAGGRGGKGQEMSGRPLQTAGHQRGPPTRLSNPMRGPFQTSECIHYRDAEPQHQGPPQNQGLYFIQVENLKV